MTEEGRQQQSELFLDGKQESINISDDIGIREPEIKFKPGSIPESFNGALPIVQATQPQKVELKMFRGVIE